jgi:Ca-activated chloride channel family protein
VTRAALLLVALAAGIGAGPQAWGKLLWMAGAPQLAVALITDKAARAAVLYELGHYAEADRLFAEVGRSATYDRALTLAATGRYGLAADYFDAVLFTNRWDDEARRNRDIVGALVEPVIGEAMGHGRIRTILAEAGLETQAFNPKAPSAPILAPEERQSTKRPIDERVVAASDDWLETLADAPGEYLAARLAAELERRRAAGAALPEEPSPW